MGCGGVGGFRSPGAEERTHTDWKNFSSQKTVFWRGGRVEWELKGKRVKGRWGGLPSRLFLQDLLRQSARLTAELLNY